ncbi:aldo/keto reductase [Phytomonospora endophytica]|uniref:Aryl-alcohol dehydrogenase-like predicted oxidoreductase n=1 Tax=Phytomonospora endophytica TaxID=714109 RepID=A0A841FGI4_9ACTN|nr:aldo/keto reductase [Phytomonospora endophytica]MBB6034755.1 aryl-alcohol dehydrogenase-like predicted oxidoreductase [Phytomonospora endophytica]GIG69042.1 oxidoreductase [Phytomonospora endophytica]
MRYRTIGTDPSTRREVSSLSLGAMLFGTDTDEKTSFAVLDRFVEAGGTFIDTSNNYAFWYDDGLGGQSEELLGRWLRSRDAYDRVVIATKLGARPRTPGTSFLDNPEGLSAKTIRAAVEGSLERLGVERLDLLYAHIEDRVTPAEETVGAFGELVAEGTVGLLGVSNHTTWRIERARAIAAATGVAGYEVLQYSHSYLRPRTDIPRGMFPDGGVHPGTELLSYLRAEPGLSLVAYSPLLKGAYTRADKPLSDDYDHPGTPARLAALREVAAETGATLNQVVLAWQTGHEIPIIPLAGASSVAQLDEILGSVELELTAEQRAKLDAAH